MNNIPSYALYGEVFDSKGLPPVNIERIQKRAQPNGWNIQPHQHENLLQFLFVERKGGVTFFDGQQVGFDAPCFIVIPSGIVHGFTFDEGIDGYVITIPQEQVEAALPISGNSVASILHKGSVIAGGSDSLLLAHLKELCEVVIFESRFAERYLNNASIHLVASIFVLISRLAENQQADENVSANRKTDLVERFRTLVNKSSTSALSVNDYAEKLGVTPSHLRRLSHEVLGQSPLSVINKRLIVVAQRELAYSTMSVQQIAYMLGFDDSAYFSRFFKKHSGKTPSQFREFIRTVGLED